MKLKLNILSLIISAFCFYTSTVKGQSDQAHSYTYFDSLTYQQYLTGNWCNLIENGKEALSMGYDSKYLRLRMGIAYFNLKDYRTAANYMTKTLQFDSYDTVAALYFNLSSQAAGRDEESYHVLGTKKPYHLLQSVYAEFGMNQGGKIRDSANLTDSVIIYKEITHPVSRTFSSFGIGLKPSEKLSVFVGATNIDLLDRKSIGYRTIDTKLTSVTDTTYGKIYHYSFPVEKHLVTEDYHSTQSSVYANMSYYPLPGLKITPAFNLLQNRLTRITATPTHQARVDTAWYNKFNTTWYTFNDTTNNYQISKSDTSYYDYALSLAGCQEIGMFILGLNGTYSRMYGAKIYQIGATDTW